jgi:hypothetical protein
MAFFLMCYWSYRIACVRNDVTSEAIGLRQSCPATRDFDQHLSPMLRARFLGHVSRADLRAREQKMDIHKPNRG